MEFDDALIKARYFCAQQERSIFEIRRKLFNWKVDEKHFDAIIQHLVKNDFLSEQRFAKLFVKSKINQRKWGRIKIRAELQKHHVDAGIIEQAIGGIDDEQVRENLNTLGDKKMAELNRRGAEQKPEKLKFYLASKGYETELIFEYLNKRKYDNE
jgi:regulatory protein